MVEEYVLRRRGESSMIRFHHQDDWQAIVARYPHVFGRQE